MNRRRELGAVVVRVKGSGPRPAAGRPSAGSGSATRRWLRRDVSLVKLAVAIIALTAIVAACLSVHSHSVRQAQAEYQVEYTQHATQTSTAPASTLPSQKPMDQEYGEWEQPQ